MVDLALTITTETNQDYDGVNEDVKKVTGTLDGAPLPETQSCPDTETDIQAKTDYKTLLTNKGYTWDTES